MKARYTPHFLSHVLALKDELATYYVQDRWFDRKTALGVELKSFMNHAAAIRWLMDCVNEDNYTIHNIRHFMALHGPLKYPLHLMDDHEVLDDVARIIMDAGYAVVIHPEFEPPWLASNTIDTLCAIEKGAPITDLNDSDTLANANRQLRHAVDMKAKNEAANVGPTAPKPQNQQISLAAQQADLRFHNENNWGPSNPGAAKKVLLNAINLLTMIAPATINSHPLDQLITEAVDAFIKSMKGPWPPPVDAEQLLAEHMKSWIQKKERVRKRPAKAATSDVPRKPLVRKPIKPKDEIPPHSVGVKLVDGNGDPLKGFVFTVKTSDGMNRTAITDDQGQGQILGIEKGVVDIIWPDIQLADE